jgi:hypothetical protein
LEYRQRMINPAVVLIRLAGFSPAEKAGIVSKAIAVHSGELTGGFTVITHRNIRIRQWRDNI